MPLAATAEQFELITDDPRADVEELGPIALLSQFRAAQAEHGELIARPLAAAILGVSAQQVGYWCLKGRLTNIEIGPVKMVSGSEVQALYQERLENDLPVGGRGKKLPSMAEQIQLGSQILGEK